MKQRERVGHELIIVQKRIDEIHPYERNPRHNDDAVKYVKKSIERFGFKVPIVIDRDGTIVAGHTRYKASLELGLETVPCVVADDLTDRQIKAFRLADNKTAEKATWDFNLLDMELTELKLDFDMRDFGFDFLEDEEKSTGHKDVDEDDFDVDDEAGKIDAPMTRLGDIYRLGNHVLMCGDSTVKSDVLRLLNGEKADMVFTDPPYGVNVKGGKNKSNIMGDLTQTAIPFSFEIAIETATKDEARFYFCGGEGNIGLYAKLFERYLQQIPRHLIWVKNGFVMKQNGYHTQYEIIFFGYKAGGGGNKHWYSGRTMEEASDVWQVKKDASNKYLHPTQKPLELPARAIRNSSCEGMMVYEPFCGSGSTLIACEQLNRRCYAMELDPKYCDVIVKRWETLTGGKAEKMI